MSGGNSFRLLMAVLLLGGFIFFYERHRDSTDEQREQMRRAFRIDPALVTGLQVRTSAYEVEVTHQNGEWQMAKPMGARAHAAIIHQVLARLQTLDRGGVITPGEMRNRNQTLADFGLTVPKAELVIRSQTGERRYHIGNPDPLGNSIYVKDADSQNVIVVSSDLLTILPEDGTVFRDRDLLTGELRDLARVDLHSAIGTLRLEDGGDGRWWLVEPVRHPADAQAIVDLLTKFGKATIEGFVDSEEGENEKFGLVAPKHSLRFHSRKGSVPTVLNLGLPVEDEPNQVYASLEGLAGVFTVSAGLKVLAETESESLRDRRVLPCLTNEVSKIHLEPVGGDSFVLERGQDGWALQFPDQPEVSVPAADGTIQTLLRVWAQARVEGYRGPAASLDDVNALYKIRFENGDQGLDLPHAFRVGASPSADGRTILMPEGKGESWVTLPDTLLRVPVEPLRYRSRMVLAVDPTEAVRISVTERFSTSRVVRVQGEASSWQTDKKEQAVNVQQVQRVLTLCRSLKAERLVNRGESDLAVYGLEHPEARVSFGLAGESPANRTLLIGRSSEDGGVYALIQGQEMVFALSSETVRSLRKPLTRESKRQATPVMKPHVPTLKP